MIINNNFINKIIIHLLCYISLVLFLRSLEIWTLSRLWQKLIRQMAGPTGQTDGKRHTNVNRWTRGSFQIFDSRHGSSQNSFLFESKYCLVSFILRRNVHNTTIQYNMYNFLYNCIINWLIVIISWKRCFVAYVANMPITAFVNKRLENRFFDPFLTIKKVYLAEL